MQDARKIYDQWLDGVNNGDAARVLALYSEDATLLPTFSSEMRTGLDRIKAYFDGLATKQHVKVETHESTVVVQQLSSTVSSISGYYDWQFGADDTPSFAAARFTFVVDAALDRPILHHHSSARPGAD